MTEDTTTKPKCFELLWLRETAGLKQGEAGARLGITRETYARYENGITPLKAGLIEQFAESLNIPVAAIPPDVEEAVRSRVFGARAYVVDATKAVDATTGTNNVGTPHHIYTRRNYRNRVADLGRFPPSRMAYFNLPFEYWEGLVTAQRDIAEMKASGFSWDQELQWRGQDAKKRGMDLFLLWNEAMELHYMEREEKAKVAREPMGLPSHKRIIEIFNRVLADRGYTMV